MNIKYFIVAILAIMTFAVHADPTNFCVLQKGKKIVKIWGDLHITDDLLEARCDVFDKGIDRCAKFPSDIKKCWLIEGNCRSLDVGIVDIVGADGQCSHLLWFLIYKAIKANKKQGNIILDLMYHGINTDIISEMDAWLDAAFINVTGHPESLEKTCKYIDPLKFTVSIEQIMILLEEEAQCLIAEFIAKDISDRARKTIKEIIEMLEKELKTLKESYKTLKETAKLLKLPRGFFTQGWGSVFRDLGNEQAGEVNNFILDMIRVKGKMGNFSFITAIQTALNNYDDITIYTGSHHAYTLRDFLIFNNGFEEKEYIGVSIPLAIEVEKSDIVAGKFSFFSPEQINDIFAKYYRDSIDHEFKIRAELKIAHEAAQVAGLRPAAPPIASAVPAKRLAAAETACESSSAGGGVGAAAMAVPSKSKVCPNCPKPADKRCSRCKAIWYCSAECQRAHWPTHNVICKPAK